MRPINKGSTPLIDGNPIRVSNYRNWRRHLIDRIGFYCSFCNMRLNDSPQVEHVTAQDLDPSLELEWSNMLLACGPCNRSKSAIPCPPTTHYMPESHNTHLAFEYFLTTHPRNNLPAAFVRSRQGVSIQAKANNTISLCALDRDTTRTPDQVTDLRWKYRAEIKISASIWRREFDEWGSLQINGFVRLLKEMVQNAGFWSIWFETFHDIFEIRMMLVQDIPGTDLGSFDPASFLPLPRTPRQSGDLV